MYSTPMAHSGKPSLLLELVTGYITDFAVFTVQGVDYLVLSQYFDPLKSKCGFISYAYSTN